MEHYPELAEELVRAIQAEGVSVLQRVAPVLERLYDEESDESDHLSLEFMENFQELVEKCELDTRSVREILGASAREDWESLYRYRHQSHWCEIDFDGRHLDGPVRTPAQLEYWAHAQGDHVPAGNSLARIRVDEAAYDLCLHFGCYTGRRALPDSQAMAPGWMLLIVLPDTDAHRRPTPPYGRLRPV